MFPLFRTLLSFFFAAYDDAAVDKHHAIAISVSSAAPTYESFTPLYIVQPKKEAAKSMEPPSKPRGCVQ